MIKHDMYMSAALDLARDAYNDNEIPVGCVISDSSGNIIGRGRNRRAGNCDAIAHAETEAISEACSAIGDYRLDGCRMYVTLEPCPMCAGAVIISRISSLYYGARNGQTGSCGSVINLFMEKYGHSCSVYGGLLADESSLLLSDFFKNIRE